MLRIKAYLVITRNTVRDFLDVAALSDTIGIDASLDALASLDRLYPQDGDRGAVRHQLLRQLAGPHPIEEEAGVELDMSEYKDIDPRWASWSAVTARCLRLSVAMGEAVAEERDGWRDLEVAP